MLKSKLLIFFLLACIVHGLNGQREVFSAQIVKENIQVEGAPVELARIEINALDSGTVIVQFTGQCYLSVGDRMIMAASDHAGWIENDGHTEFETVDDAKGKAFSHTRTYRVGEGTHTFYAVGENAVETDGTGESTIYGLLTAEFIPDGDAVLVESKGVVFSHHDTEVHVADSLKIQVPTFGQVIARFDGFVISEPMDPIVVSASDGPYWTGSSGELMVKTFYEDESQSTFSHTDVFYVDDPGEFTYYAVIHNFDIEQGVGGDYSVYGNLTVEFYPYAFGIVGDYQVSPIGVEDSIIHLKTITIHAPDPGYLLLNTDGYVRSERETVSQIAAGHELYMGPNEESVTIYQNGFGSSFVSYVHRRVYPIGPGTYTLYTTAKVHDTPESLDYINAIGNFAVKYFPNPSTSAEPAEAAQKEISIYPQPAGERVTVLFEENIVSDLPVMIFDMQGRHQRIHHVSTGKGVVIDLSGCVAGMYFLRVGDEVRKIIKI